MEYSIDDLIDIIKELGWDIIEIQCSLSYICVGNGKGIDARNTKLFRRGSWLKEEEFKKLIEHAKKYPGN